MRQKNLKSLISKYKECRHDAKKDVDEALEAVELLAGTKTGISIIRKGSFVFSRRGLSSFLLSVLISERLGSKFLGELAEALKKEVQV